MISYLRATGARLGDTHVLRAADTIAIGMSVLDLLPASWSKSLSPRQSSGAQCSHAGGPPGRPDERVWYQRHRRRQNDDDVDDDDSGEAESTATLSHRHPDTAVATYILGRGTATQLRQGMRWDRRTSVKFKDDFSRPKPFFLRDILVSPLHSRRSANQFSRIRINFHICDRNAMTMTHRQHNRKWRGSGKRFARLYFLVGIIRGSRGRGEEPCSLPSNLRLWCG